MTLPLTIDSLAAAYEYLCTTPPFNKWNLPPGEEIKFKISRSQREFAHYQWDGERHNISLSEAAVGHTITLMIALAHEIIHLHLEATKQESKRGSRNTHNAAFRKYADRVCKVHGFDVKAFY